MYIENFGHQTWSVKMKIIEKKIFVIFDAIKVLLSKTSTTKPNPSDIKKLNSYINNSDINSYVDHMNAYIVNSFKRLNHN